MQSFRFFLTNPDRSCIRRDRLAKALSPGPRSDRAGFTTASAAPSNPLSRPSRDALSARAHSRAYFKKIMTTNSHAADEPTDIPVSVRLRGAVADAFLQAVNDANDSRAGFIRKMVASQLRVAGYLPAIKATHRTANRTLTEAAR